MFASTCYKGFLDLQHCFSDFKTVLTERKTSVAFADVVTGGGRLLVRGVWSEQLVISYKLSGVDSLSF